MSVRGTVDVHGHAEAGFESLVDVFAENWDLYDEVGAGFSLYVDGEEKMSIWAGSADPDAGRPWQEDTMAVTFSATKGVTAVCVHHLAEQGAIDLDAPVARYWPEFGAAGKDNIPIRWVLSHRAGLHSIEAPLTLEEVARRPSCRGRARPAGTVVGAGHCASVPPAQLRLHPRRAGAPRDRKDAGAVRTRGRGRAH